MIWAMRMSIGNESKKLVGWVIQNNFDAEPEATKQMVEWCKSNNIPYQLIDYIPFSNRLPEINFIHPIFYGNTRVTELALEQGYSLYYCKWDFSIGHLVENLRGYCINKDFIKTTVKRFKKDWHGEIPRFVRPDLGLKAFPGQVFYTESDMSYAFDSACAQNLLNNNSIIYHCSPKHIEKEWRCVVVNQKVISISKYNENYKLVVEEEIDSEVWDNAREFAKLPEFENFSTVFVMDIGYCSSIPELYGIIELNSFHAAGWYANNVPKVMREVTHAFIEDDNYINVHGRLKTSIF